jgi:hypothetical protein
MDIKGATVKLYDGVSSVTFLGNDKIDTVLGQKEAMKIKSLRKYQAEGSHNGVSMLMDMDYETISYYVEGIGEVKAQVKITVKSLDGQILSNEEHTVELTEYTAPSGN